MAEISIGDVDAPPSLARAFADVMKRHSTAKCLGWRPHAAADFEWCTYATFERQSTSVASALASIVDVGDRVGILGENCYDWFVADFACLWAGAASVPLSEAWDAHVLEKVLEHTGVRLVFCLLEYVPQVVSAAHATGCRVPMIVSFGGGSSDAAAAAASAASSASIRHVSLADFESSAPARATMLCRERAADGVHTILHTSGTTGLPKGVVYSDRLWLHNMATYGGLQVGFSYMPLAFITDRHTVYTTLWNGGRVGIATPASVGTQSIAEERLLRDLRDLQPTVLKGVPKFWEQLYEASRLVQDRRLLILGGRAAVLCCGAGALSRGLAAYFRESCTTAEGAPVLFMEMYGGTECGNIAVNRKVLDHVQCRLAPVDGFTVQHSGGGSHSRVEVGELLVRTGNMMFSGYYGDEERTRDAFTRDRFYRTGDIVRLETTSDGGRYVDVIGRAKSSIKMGNGKWVHPEALEDLYRAAAGVDAVFIHGDSSHSHLVAVVEARGSRSAEATAEGLVKSFAEMAASAGTAAHERVRAVVLAEAPFSVAAGTLNGTGKLVRQKLRQLYEAALSEALDRVELSMGLEHLEEGRSFHEQGGTSLQATRIAGLYQKLGVPLAHAVAVLLQARTVGDAKSELRKGLAAADRQPDVDCSLAPLASPPCASRSDRWRRELSSWMPAAVRGKRAILLTGATGFVGKFLLAELLLRSAESTIVCLVRANNREEAMERVQKALLETRRWRPEWRGRLQVATGSLGPDLLGIGSVAEWRALAATVHTVVHSGAVVDLKQPYAFHWKSNVQGTLEVLRFCREASARIIFLSTTDVLPRPSAAPSSGASSTEGGEAATTSSAVPAERAVRVDEVREAAEDSGYAASKAVGEYLVDAACRRGDLRGLIARLGMVAGCSQTGANAPTDFVSRLLLGIAATRAFPCTDGQRQTMVHSLPVDVVAAAIVDLALGSSSGETVNLVSGAPRQSMEALRQSLLAFGPPYEALPLLPFPEWMRRVQADAALSLWPIFSWAASREAFPEFNQRCPPLGRCAQLVRAGTAAAMRRGFDEPALHRMVANLFATSGQLRGQLNWQHVRHAFAPKLALLKSAGGEAAGGADDARTVSGRGGDGMGPLRVAVAGAVVAGVVAGYCMSRRKGNT